MSEPKVILSDSDRAFWEENGYVVVPNAVPRENLDRLVDAIWEFLEIDRDDPFVPFRPLRPIRPKSPHLAEPPSISCAR